MLEMFSIAAICLALAVISTALANRLKISMALMEICVGAAAGYAITRFALPDVLQPNSKWIKFAAGTGAVLLTFPTDAELDPVSMKSKIKEISVVGFIGFPAPFAG